MDLLSDILAAPDDDAPRLVYADALLDRGDASQDGERLTGLDLRYQQIGDAGLTRLLAVLRFAPITWLGLEANQLGDGSARLIARAPWFSRLRNLILDENAITDVGAIELGNLRELGLCRCGIGPAGARALASSPALARLETIDLTSNLIENDGAKALLNSPHLPRSMELGLSGFGRYPVGVSPKLIDALRGRFAKVHTFFMADHQR